MMIVEELRRALENAGILQRPISDPEAKSLDRLLRDYADLSLAEFCQKSREGLKKEPEPKTAAPPESLIPQSPVDRYLSELENTKTDSGQFEDVVARIKADKRMRIDEAREIAMRFVGGVRKYKTKADAFKAILQRQIADVRAADKIKRVRDIF